MNFSFQEFLAGCVGGTLGITLSYPIDTFKTLRQTGQAIQYKKLYVGYSSPLLGMMAEKSVLFWGFDLTRKNTTLNVFNSGLVAGLMTTVVVTPFERIKIRSQTTGKSAFPTLLTILKTDGAVSLYRGWTATLFREVPGYGIYFTTYNLGRKYFPTDYFSNYLAKQPLNLLSTALCGSLAGMSAWTFIYPSDPIKTVAQNDNISTVRAFNKIWTKNGIKGLYVGFTPAIIRAGVLHCGVFLGYELSKNYLSSIRDDK